MLFHGLPYFNENKLSNSSTRLSILRTMPDAKDFYGSGTRHAIGNNKRQFRNHKLAGSLLCRLCHSPENDGESGRCCKWRGKRGWRWRDYVRVRCEKK